MDQKRVDVLIALAGFFQFGFLASIGALVSELRTEQPGIAILILLSICASITLIIGSGIYINLVMNTNANHNEHHS